jgi:hypothetical protein
MPPAHTDVGLVATCGRMTPSWGEHRLPGDIGNPGNNSLMPGHINGIRMDVHSHASLLCEKGIKEVHHEGKGGDGNDEACDGAKGGKGRDGDEQAGREGSGLKGSAEAFR